VACSERLQRTAYNRRRAYALAYIKRRDAKRLDGRAVSCPEQVAAEMASAPDLSHFKPIFMGAPADAVDPYDSELESRNLIPIDHVYDPMVTSR